MNYDFFIEHGFSLNQINIIVKLNSLKAPYLEKISPTVSVEQLRLLKNFYEDNHPNKGTFHIAIKAMNQDLDFSKYLQNENLNSKQLAALFKGLEKGLDISMFDETFSDKDILLGLNYQAKGKDIIPLLKRNFDEEQLRLLASNLDLNLDKFNSEMKLKTIQLYISAFRSGFDPFALKEKINQPDSKMELYFSALKKGVYLDDFMTYSSNKLKTIVSIIETYNDHEGLETYLKNGYNSQKIKTLFRIKSNGLDPSLFEKFPSVEIITFFADIYKKDKDSFDILNKNFDIEQYNILIKSYNKLRKANKLDKLNEITQTEYNSQLIESITNLIIEEKDYTPLTLYNFNTFQIDFLTRCLLKDIDITKFAFPEIAASKMETIQRLLSQGFDIDCTNYVKNNSKTILPEDEDIEYAFKLRREKYFGKDDSDMEL